MEFQDEIVGMGKSDYKGEELGVIKRPITFEDQATLTTGRLGVESVTMASIDLGIYLLLVVYVRLRVILRKKNNIQ
jgi:small-conductance mechanosensitive channel